MDEFARALGYIVIIFGCVVFVICSFAGILWMVAESSWKRLDSSMKYYKFAKWYKENYPNGD